MYSIIKHNDNIAYDVNEYVCNSVFDLISLPQCAPGSTAIVLQPGNTQVYVKDPEGVWVKLTDTVNQKVYLNDGVLTIE